MILSKKNYSEMSQSDETGLLHSFLVEVVALKQSANEPEETKIETIELEISALLNDQRIFYTMKSPVPSEKKQRSSIESVEDVIKAIDFARSTHLALKKKANSLFIRYAIKAREYKSSKGRCIQISFYDFFKISGEKKLSFSYSQENSMHGDSEVNLAKPLRIIQEFFGNKSQEFGFEQTLSNKFYKLFSKDIKPLSSKIFVFGHLSQCPSMKAEAKLILGFLDTLSERKNAFATLFVHRMKEFFKKKKWLQGKNFQAIFYGRPSALSRKSGETNRKSSLNVMFTRDQLAASPSEPEGPGSFNVTIVNKGRPSTTSILKKSSYMADERRKKQEKMIEEPSPGTRMIEEKGNQARSMDIERESPVEDFERTELKSESQRHLKIINEKARKMLEEIKGIEERPVESPFESAETQKRMYELYKENSLMVQTMASEREKLKKKEKEIERLTKKLEMQKKKFKEVIEEKNEVILRMKEIQKRKQKKMESREEEINC